MNNILTKVNSRKPSFNELIECRNKAPQINIEQLATFAKFVHGVKADYIVNESSVQAFTAKKQYIYSCFGGLIFRSANDSNTQDRKIYFIS